MDIMYTSELRPLIFAGGSGMKNLIDEIASVVQRDHGLHIVVPVTDDGGSTGEIVRAIGGVALGDIRQVLLRLGHFAASALPAEQAKACRALDAFLNHRLPCDAAAAKAEWQALMSCSFVGPGDHPLLQDLHPEQVAMLRLFLKPFHARTQRAPAAAFCFSNGCLGNFFLAGAASAYCLDTGILALEFLFRIPSNFRVHPACLAPGNARTVGLGLAMEDGDVILGQNNISHPPVCGGSAHVVEKDAERQDPLPAKPSDLFFIDEWERRIEPEVNPRVLEQVLACNVVIYGRGSFLSSILPSLRFPAVTEAIRARADIPKVFIANGVNDRETSHLTAGRAPHAMTVCDMITLMLSILHVPDAAYLEYVTHVLLPENGKVSEGNLRAAYPGLTVETIPCLKGKQQPTYDDAVIVDYLKSLVEPEAFLPEAKLILSDDVHI
ncbi:hypothetical protein DIPPA_15549 [Diplonema papillatum]|nr:hypothetical protein DIPPA_15549 [Diplonema papillatum]